jgi:hypothetical protein
MPLSAGALRLIDLVTSYVGCSLEQRTAELGDLVARDVDDPKAMVNVHTNCGTFALGIWQRVGVPHELLARPYVNEMAISWIIQIAHEFGAVRYPKRDGKPKPGSLMHYWYRVGKVTSHHHVEFLLSELDPHNQGTHAGGGRDKNAITASIGDVYWVGGTPLQAWYDVDELLDGWE